MDDFSNHLSAKDASRNSKNAAWGGTFAQPKVWVSFFIKCFFENLNLEKFKLHTVFKNNACLNELKFFLKLFSGNAEF